MTWRTQSQPDQRTHYQRSASTSPTISDDSTAGFSIGDKWLNTTKKDAYELVDASVGAALWKRVTNIGDVVSVLAGILLGSLLDYPSSGSFTVGEVQYVRVNLVGGTVIPGGITFIDSGGNNSRNIRMGLYNQTDPTDRDLEPNSQVAQTAVYVTTGNGYRNHPWIGGDYTVPSTGFYWVALITDSSPLKFAVSATYRANYLPVCRETSSGTTLPSSASNLSNPISAIALAGLDVV